MKVPEFEKRLLELCEQLEVTDQRSDAIQGIVYGVLSAIVSQEEIVLADLMIHFVEQLKDKLIQQIQTAASLN